MRGAVVVLAGGEGNRFGGDKPKQFVRIGGKPIFVWTLMIPLSLNFDRIVLVFNRNWMDEAVVELKREGLAGKVELVEGGETRQISARNALKHLKKFEMDFVLIHDANRPFATSELYLRILDGLFKYDSCVPVIKPRDSVYRVEDEVVLGIENRDSLGLIQTPQGFRYDLIERLHEKAYLEGKTDFPDDSSILLHFGYPVHIVDGELTNIKITYREDIRMAENLLNLLHSWE